MTFVIYSRFKNKKIQNKLDEVFYVKFIPNNILCNGYLKLKFSC